MIHPINYSIDLCSNKQIRMIDTKETEELYYRDGSIAKIIIGTIDILFTVNLLLFLF